MANDGTLPIYWLSVPSPEVDRLIRKEQRGPYSKGVALQEAYALTCSTGFIHQVNVRFRGGYSVCRTETRATLEDQKRLKETVDSYRPPGLLSALLGLDD